MCKILVPVYVCNSCFYSVSRYSSLSSRLQLLFNFIRRLYLRLSPWMVMFIVGWPVTGYWMLCHCFHLYVHSFIRIIISFESCLMHFWLRFQVCPVIVGTCFTCACLFSTPEKFSHFTLFFPIDLTYYYYIYLFPGGVVLQYFMLVEKWQNSLTNQRVNMLSIFSC